MDSRSHRGAHPKDATLFAAETIGPLRDALADYCMLLTKGYADKSALKLVGDHFSLTARQRLAVMRCSCSDSQLSNRASKRIDVARLTGKPLEIDGYNLLITVEAALSDGLLFTGRDGCMRDLASIHGTYRKVTETLPALELIGRFLANLNPASIRWLLDSPVSNSGRLKTLMRQTAEANDWPWRIDLLQSPDAHLARTQAVVASSDSAILDKCAQWTNLAAEIITRTIPDAKIVNLSTT